MKQNLNNDALYSIANVLDSVTYTPSIVCNHHLSSYALRCSRPQTNLNSPESRPLDPPRVLELGGFIF